MSDQPLETPETNPDPAEQAPAHSPEDARLLEEMRRDDYFNSDRFTDDDLLKIGNYWRDTRADIDNDMSARFNYLYNQSVASYCTRYGITPEALTASGFNQDDAWTEDNRLDSDKLNEAARLAAEKFRIAKPGSFETNPINAGSLPPSKSDDNWMQLLRHARQGGGSITSDHVGPIRF